MRIPLVDVELQHREIATALDKAIRDVMAHCRFVLGPEVELFEQEFCRFCQARFCVGVANGTDAVELALRSIGVQAGDEVIVPVNTFVATALAVSRTGATLVFVDCDPDQFLIDPRAVEQALGRDTKAVIAVHLFGQMAPMAELQDLVRGRGAHLIADAAQAHGANDGAHGICGGALAAATSFYPGKNLGALGDAGAVLTDSEEIACALRRLRNYGSERKYEHPQFGVNSRLDTIQAAVLRVKLSHLEVWNRQRREAALVYEQLLADLPEVKRPSCAQGNYHVYHLYVVQVPNRDRVIERLHAAGIGALIHYPRPLHLLGVFKSLSYKQGDFPVAERLAGRILSLPLYPGITPRQQGEVVDCLRDALASS